MHICPCSRLRWQSTLTATFTAPQGISRYRITHKVDIKCRILQLPRDIGT